MEHTGFEPVTPSLPAKYSPAELMPRYLTEYLLKISTVESR